MKHVCLHSNHKFIFKSALFKMFKTCNKVQKIYLKKIVQIVKFNSQNQSNYIKWLRLQLIPTNTMEEQYLTFLQRELCSELYCSKCHLHSDGISLLIFMKISGVFFSGIGSRYYIFTYQGGQIQLLLYHLLTGELLHRTKCKL